jgi:hypothetical protein
MRSEQANLTRRAKLKPQFDFSHHCCSLADEEGMVNPTLALVYGQSKLHLTEWGVPQICDLSQNIDNSLLAMGAT